MKANQIVLPFRAKRAERRRNSNLDLIGRTYVEDHARVTVIGICENDDRRVMVRRHPGGSTWSMPAWLMRLIFVEKKRKRAA